MESASVVDSKVPVSMVELSCSDAGGVLRLLVDDEGRNVVSHNAERFSERAICALHLSNGCNQRRVVLDEEVIGMQEGCRPCILHDGVQSPDAKSSSIQAQTPDKCRDMRHLTERRGCHPQNRTVNEFVEVEEGITGRDGSCGASQIHWSRIDTTPDDGESEDRIDLGDEWEDSRVLGD